MRVSIFGRATTADATKVLLLDSGEIGKNCHRAIAKVTQ